MNQTREKIRDADRSRGAIMDAARHEFVEKGFDATRVADISRRAGIHQSLLYHYFPSKEVLYARVYETALEPYYRLVEALLDCPDTDWSWLERYIATYFHFLKANPDLARLKSWEFVARRLQPDALDLNRIFSLYQRTEARLRALEQNGAIRAGVEPSGLVISITSLVDYWFMGAATWIPPEIPEEERDRTRLNQLLDLLAHSLKPLPSPSL